MPKFLDNIKSILSNKKVNQNNCNVNRDETNSNAISTLETDAAPVPDDNDSDVESMYNNESRTSSMSSQMSNLNLHSIQRQESLTPLKQHRIVEATNCNNNISDNTNQQLVPSSNYEDNRVAMIPTHATLNQTQAQNVYQISHASGVHIGNVITFNSATQNNTNEPRTPSIGAIPTADIPQSGIRKSSSQTSNGYPVTKTISEMMKSNLTVDEKFLDVIATHLINWKDIARKLDYADGQIDHFFLDNHIYGTKEIIYQMLLDWIRNANEPTLGILTKILWRYNNQEAVLYLKPMYKARKNELLQRNNIEDNN